VKVYDRVTKRNLDGLESPDQVITYAHGDQFYPPQPLWVTLVDTP